MPSLNELVRQHTTLTGADVEWLHLLVSEWQLLSDLSFAGPERDAAKTAVLLGSLVAAALGSAVLVARNRFHRGRTPISGPYADEA